MIHATCTKCGDRKPSSDFRRNPRRPNGLTTQCAKCIRKQERDKYAETHGGDWCARACAHCGEMFEHEKKPGNPRIYCSERCKANAAAAAQKSRNYHAIRRCKCGSTDVAKVGLAVCPSCKVDKRDPGKRRASNRARRFSLYGITEDDFNELLAQQRGKCAVCATLDPGPRGWFIDHDHACCAGIGSCGNCIRGLLCQDCNFILGLAKDSTDRLLAAAKYLDVNSQFKIPLELVR